MGGRTTGVAFRDELAGGPVRDDDREGRRLSGGEGGKDIDGRGRGDERREYRWRSVAKELGDDLQVVRRSWEERSAAALHERRTYLGWTR